MMRLFSLIVFAVLANLISGITTVRAQEIKSIQLPPPQTMGGMPLMQALKERKSSRDFSSEKLPDQLLSNLLWAAFGINRPESGGRTAPSARNRQEIDLYIVTSDAAHLYEARSHTLKPVVPGDLRGKTGVQSFVKEAPVNLVYVADFAKISGATNEDMQFYSTADVGFISQNVYLFCASEGLATVVRGALDRSALAVALKLRPEQKVVLSQTVGYPKK